MNNRSFKPENILFYPFCVNATVTHQQVFTVLQITLQSLQHLRQPSRICLPRDKAYRSISSCDIKKYNSYFVTLLESKSKLTFSVTGRDMEEKQWKFCGVCCRAKSWLLVLLLCLAAFVQDQVLILFETIQLTSSKDPLTVSSPYFVF